MWKSIRIMTGLSSLEKKTFIQVKGGEDTDETKTRKGNTGKF